MVTFGTNAPMLPSEPILGQKTSGSHETSPVSDLAANVIQGAENEAPIAMRNITASLEEGGESIDWGAFKLSDDELQELEDELPSLAEALHDGEKDYALSTEGLESLELANGEVMTPIEVVALRFYTADGFKLINGTFKYEKSILNFMEGRHIPHDDLDVVKKAGQKLARAVASALNKLPPAKETVLFRGSTVSEENIEKYKPGQIITQGKFSSLSVQEGVAGKFASANADNTPGVYTIYVVENPTCAKDVDLFSATPKENERIYPPNQSFEITRVVNDEVYNTLQLDSKEDIEEARQAGTLKEATVMKKNGQLKQIYYVEMRDHPPQRVLRIFMKEFKL